MLCLKMSDKKVRLARTTRKQYEELVAFLESNPSVSRGKNKPSDSLKVQKLWETFAKEVNSKNIGPFKSTEQWKRILTEWKVNTKRKSREILLSQNATGGGPAAKKTLTDLEERLLAIFSKIHLGEPLIPDNLGSVNENVIVIEAVDPIQDNKHAELDQVYFTSSLNDIQWEENVEYHMEVTETAELTSSEEVNNPVTDEKGNISQNNDGLQYSRRQAAYKEDKVEICGNKPSTSFPITKKSKYTDNRYTSAALKEAINKFAEVQNVNLEMTKLQENSINQLSSTLGNIGDTLEKTNTIFGKFVEAKMVSAEANLIRARAKQMQAKIKLIKLLNNKDL